MTSDRETVFITGAGRGIGEAIALAFARSRANVVLLSRTAAELQSVARATEAVGAKTLVCPVDVTRPPDIDRAVATALGEFGQIDVLVNCAGVYGPIGLLIDNDMEAWAQALQINLMGTVFCLHAVLPHMIARRKGAVINFSGGGAVSPFPHFSAYSASKAAVVRLTETVAEEVKEFGIRINAVAPGAVNTRLLGQVLEAGEAAAGKDFYKKAQQQQQQGGTPPERAAELVILLASPAAQCITGRLISAVWDDWKALPTQFQDRGQSSLFTMRRIDGRNFMEVR